MASRDPILTAYVVHRLKVLKDEGKEWKSLAVPAGLEASIPSQVSLGRMGVGGRTALPFARMLGFERVPELQQAAETWAEANGVVDEPQPVRMAPHPRSRRIAQSIGVLDAAIARVDAMYADARYAQENERWWLEHYLAEDRMARQELVAPPPETKGKKLKLTPRSGPRDTAEGSSSHKKPA